MQDTRSSGVTDAPPAGQRPSRGTTDVQALLSGITTVLRNDSAAVAAALGVCRSDLWRWEAGEPPSDEACARIERLAACAGRLVADGTVRAAAQPLRGSGTERV